MLEIHTKAIDNAVIIEIKGDVDLYSSPKVRKALMKLIEKKPILLIDLNEVVYLDSSGVATFVESLQRINEYQGKMGIFNVHGAVRDVFELSKLDKVFNIFENEAAALNAWQ
jgi:anti-sigma B factor antagonist